MTEQELTAIFEDVFRMKNNLKVMRRRLEAEAEQMWLALDRFVTKPEPDAKPKK